MAPNLQALSTLTTSKPLCVPGIQSGSTSMHERYMHIKIFSQNNLILLHCHVPYITVSIKKQISTSKHIKYIKIKITDRYFSFFFCSINLHLQLYKCKTEHPECNIRIKMISKPLWLFTSSVKVLFFITLRNLDSQWSRDYQPVCVI